VVLPIINNIHSANKRGSEMSTEKVIIKKKATTPKKDKNDKITFNNLININHEEKIIPHTAENKILGNLDKQIKMSKTIDLGNGNSGNNGNSKQEKVDKSENR